MQTKIYPSWNVKLKYHKKWFLPLSTTISGEGKAIDFLQVSIKEQGPSYFLTPPRNIRLTPQFGRLFLQRYR